MNQNNRRNFIKNAAVLGMGVPAVLGPVSAAFASDANAEHANANAGTSKQAPNQFSVFILPICMRKFIPTTNFFGRMKKLCIKNVVDLRYLKP